MKSLLLNIILSGLVSMAVVVGYETYIKKDVIFVSVDIDGIIKEQQKVFREQLKYAQSAEELAEIHNASVRFSNTLYLSVKKYGEQNNAVVFQSTALLSGEAKDITNEVLTAIKQ